MVGDGFIGLVSFLASYRESWEQFPETDQLACNIAPAMTNVTATIIITSPKLSLTVRLSPKTAIPKKMAVTGSNAPRMAVGVEPIYWMAPVVQRKDMAVGKTASASRLAHRYHWSGVFSTPE